MLDFFIAAHRDEIIARCRTKARLRSTDVRVDAAATHGVPLFLEQLMNELQRVGPSADHAAPRDDIGTSARYHGRTLLARGLTASEVVHEYGDVCQSITELAMELDLPITTADFRTLNRCLDEAIAGAVTEFGRGREQSSRSNAAAQGSERLGFFAHELRNLVNTAIVSFEVLRTGNVGVSGSTGTVLQRSLLGLRALIARSLAEVRLTRDVQNVERMRVSVLIDDVGAAAALEGLAAGITLVVDPVDPALMVDVDRQVIGAVLANLLQNAFKFTRPHTLVTLRVQPGEERVLIEVEDHCGGLPAGNYEDLFRPFEQRGQDRSGLGLGLAFSRWGAEANHGRISARNVPGGGCVFTVDLPRVPASAGAPE